MNTGRIDLCLALGLFGLWLLWLAAYGLRCIRKGPAEHARVGRQGGTVFLGTAVMNAGYWLLEPLARLFVAAGISASALSWFSLVPALGSALAVGLGFWGLAAWGVFLSALLDVLDGAVARLGGTASPAGAILDSTLDRYAEFLFFGGLLVCWCDDIGLQLLAFTAVAGSVLVTYSTAKAEALQLTPPRGLMKRSDRLSCLCVGLVLSQPWCVWRAGDCTLGMDGELPLILAVTLIAVLANVSAVHRFCSLARQVMK